MGAATTTRPLRLAFIVDPLATLKAYKDSSIAMMRAAQARGHAVFAIEAQTLGWQGVVFGLAQALELCPGNDVWCRAQPGLRYALRDFDAVVMRKDPPFDSEFLTVTWLLERAEAEGARVFNRPRAVRDHSEKLALLEFAHFAPSTAVARDPAQIHAFIDHERDTILKPLDGMGGSQIFRVRHDDPNRNVIVETLTNDGQRTIMAQRYLPAISEGDKRILLIAGEPVPYALARIPKAGETRGNLAVGGRGVAQALSPRDREIASALGPILQARGLLLVGIDVIGEHLTEINVTSPTCMVEIFTQTGCNAAELFITAIENACV